MAEIALTRGFIAIVDDTDFERLSKKKWMANVNTHQVRACRQERRGGVVRQIYMHHEVLDVDSGFLKFSDKEVDHINGNTLDNRKENLRIVNHTENMRNTKRHIERVGYSYSKRAKRWLCYLDQPDKPRKYLGYTKTKEEAELRIKEARKCQ